jgi:hypothetical protein
VWHWQNPTSLQLDRDWWSHVKKLPYISEGGGSLASKKHKHVCFMFELFFAVSLEPRENITNNP